MKKDWFSNFCVFVKKLRNHYTKLQKRRKFKNWHLLFLIIFPILSELQICTVPHFKAPEELFLQLAWFLTLGAITFLFLSKESVYFFLTHFKSVFHYWKLNHQSFLRVDKKPLRSRSCNFFYWPWKKRLAHFKDPQGEGIFFDQSTKFLGRNNGVHFLIWPLWDLWVGTIVDFALGGTFRATIFSWVNLVMVNSV